MTSNLPARDVVLGPTNTSLAFGDLLETVMAVQQIKREGAETLRKHYLENKKILKDDIDDAEKRGVYSATRNFGRMIDRVSDVESPLTQTKLVNAWVNIAVEPDDEQGKIFDQTGKTCSLSRILSEGKGFSLQIAELKLFALEEAGYNQKDVFVVNERFYQSKQRDEDYLGQTSLFYEGESHIVVAHAKDRFWALESYTGLFGERRSINNGRDAWNSIFDAAEMEPAAAHLNISNNSFIRSRYNPCCLKCIGQGINVPMASFNSTHAEEYEHGIDYAAIRGEKLANVFPKEVSEAKRGDTVTLSHEDIAKTDICAIMGPLISNKGYGLPLGAAFCAMLASPHEPNIHSFKESERPDSWYIPLPENQNWKILGL